MEILKKVFKRNDSLTTESNYTLGRTSVDRADVAVELYNRDMVNYNVNNLSGKKRQKKLYSLSKTEKFRIIEAEMNAQLTTKEINNEFVGEMLFVVDGRTPRNLVDQCIKSSLVGLPQLNPRTNKLVVKQMNWINKAS